MATNFPLTTLEGLQRISQMADEREAYRDRVAQLESRLADMEYDYAVLENKNALLCYGLKATLSRVTNGVLFNEMLDTPKDTVMLAECVLAHADCGFEDIHIMEAA